jgi:hypothetical protein
VTMKWRLAGFLPATRCPQNPARCADLNRGLSSPTLRVSIHAAAAIAILLLLAAPAFAAPPTWAKNVKTTVKKDFDFEEIVVEVDGVQAGYRYDHGKRYDLKWERDPRALGLKHRLHAHEITKEFPAELDPLPTPGAVPIALADIPAAVAADTTPRVIDVNYFYTAASAAANGGEGTMPAFAALSCALTNQAYANSGLGWITFRCLGPFKASYADTTNLTDALNWLGMSGAGASEVAAKYALTGADLSHMTIAKSGGGCGLGYMPASASFALSTSDRTCSNANLSFPHETGHNVGYNHDPANAGCTLTAQPSGQLGCSGSYNYGHSFPIGAPKWRTVMAYPGALGTRITQFSNPLVLYQGLYPTGIVNERDNARIAVARAAILAAFRTAVVTTPHPPSKVSNLQPVQ